MDLSDPTKSKSQSSIDEIKDMWNYGFEAWTNLPGRYVTFEADLSTVTAPYKMNICSVGIFGTKYVRAISITTSVSLGVNQASHSISIDNITSEYPIGNVLDVYVRQKSGTEKSWVTIITQGNPSILNLKPYLASPAIHTIEIESYDNSSAVNSTLKTDSIIVEIIDFWRPVTITLSYEIIPNKPVPILINNI